MIILSSLGASGAADSIAYENSHFVPDFQSVHFFSHNDVYTGTFYCFEIDITRTFIGNLQMRVINPPHL